MSSPRGQAGFAVREAAARVGVSPSTLRSWERRYGLAPSMRTGGGHRRYSASDIASLQQLRRLTSTGAATASAARAITRAGRPLPMRRGGQDRWGAAADSMDASRCGLAARAVLAKRGAAAAWSEVFTPWLRAIGERWAATGGGVEREHVATESVQQALAAHARRRIAPGTPSRLLAAAAPDEQHVLPLHALAATVAEHGVGSLVLNALPERGLLAAVTELSPAVVVVWAQERRTADPALLTALVPHVPSVFAAGPGWAAEPPPGVAGVLTEFVPAVTDVLALTGGR